MKGFIEPTSRTLWWAKRRFRYNIGLLLSGLLAFISYVTTIFIFEKQFPDLEITIFTTIFQAIGYFFAMIIANIFYYLGPLAERFVRPKNPDRFRVITYNIGFYFSLVLPFSIPGFVILSLI